MNTPLGSASFAMPGPSKNLDRIDRLLAGKAGDVAPIGDGLSELRIHYGPDIEFISPIAGRR
jgi:hypothetical protein